MPVDLLVLGAEGFLGRYLVHEAERSSHVRRVHRALRWRDSSSPGAFGVAIEQALLSMGSAVVINAIGGPKGPDLPELNLGPLQAIAEAMGRRGNVDSLVHIGSAAEYGDISSPMSETDQCTPHSPYGRAKLAATHRALAMGRAVVLRPFSVVGAGMPEHTLLGRLSTSILRRDQTFDAGSLSAIRDFVDVRDVSRAVLLAAEAVTRDNTVAGQIVNVGSGNGMVVRDMVNLVLTQARSGLIVRESAAGLTTSHAVAEASKAQVLLGWTPRIRPAAMATEVVNNAATSRGI